MKESEKFYITTPIYYVNDEPHIGHAYTTILADILAKYHRLLGDKAYFLTGTDEHGQKVQLSAENRNLSPQEHCDEMVLHFKTIWKKLDIDYDDFIRTTEKRHYEIVRQVLTYLMNKGEIYQDEFEGWYCIPDERYFTDKDLVEGNCPLCGRQVTMMREKNYFFRMSRYRQWLYDYINEHPDFIQPDFRRNEVLGFLRQPLKDLCISRPISRLSWGIPLPFDENYVTYVWFDALLNYYSAVKEKGLWPASVHLIGKDILTTHAVYWPIMLKAADLELPATIFAHGWWLFEETKMSKSLGNVIKPLQMIDQYGVDEFRYFLMREMTPGMDASFSEMNLIHRINNDLANDLGNLLSRISTLIFTYFEGIIPPPTETSTQVFDADRLFSDLKKALSAFKINEIMQLALEPVKWANKYLEDNTPWRSAKTDKTESGNVLYNALEGLRLSAVLMKPVMPHKCREILRRIAAENTGLTWGQLKPFVRIIKGEAVFPRIEIPEIIKTLETPETKIEEAELISIEDFNKLELKVAEIISAEKIEGTNKLLKLQVDIGGETRQLVAGIAQFYSSEDLPGKQIIVLVNLNKVKIKGVESEGMLLAATSEENLRLLTVDGAIPSGAKIS